MAVVQVQGPVHEIEPQPYWRISFNIGPSYSVEAESAGAQARTLACKRHALMVIPPDVSLLHRAATPRPAGRAAKPVRLATFRISRELFSQAAMALGLQYRDARLEHQIVPADEVLKLQAQALLTDLREGNPDGAAATERTAAALVSRLLVRSTARKPTSSRGALDKVQAHIDANLQADLALEQLAQIAGMSLFHFCRVFRDNLGVTPHQFIVTRRLERAQRLLWANRSSSDTALSVLQVALACGFNSPSHFAAQFKRHTGKTPMQWQRGA